MGITAKGAWEAVKRHFREMNRDIQTTPFTVVGVGDMSGDVFGNGMLLSDQTRLIAAFDHRDIFIDPDPDPAVSMAERQRMFALPRSSWQDYDKSKLSAGGVIVSRSQKSITLPAAAAAAIGLEKTVASPVEIMKAILQAPADLLWFGGIGTYVRATTETNQDVGDRANDAIRVTAAEVRAKVIGEGANLGVTQRARIQFGLLGGACNSDAIDNSGGVNCSDVEVNIKIALASAMRRRRAGASGARQAARRHDRRGVAAGAFQQLPADAGALRRPQGRHGRLPASGALHDGARSARPARPRGRDAAVAGRTRRTRGAPRAADQGRTRRAARLRQDRALLRHRRQRRARRSAFRARSLGLFPRPHGEEIRRRHRLAPAAARDHRAGRRQRPHQPRRPVLRDAAQDATGRGAREVVRAFAVVRDGFGLPALYREIDALDNRIDGQVQLDLYAAVGRLVLAASAWDLKNGSGTAPLGAQIAALQDARKLLEPKLASLLPDFTRERMTVRKLALVEAGAPEKLAERLALLDVSALIPDIALVARDAKSDLLAAAKAFFAVTEAFRISHIEDAAGAIATSDYYEGMALSRAGRHDRRGAAGHGGRRAHRLTARRAIRSAAWLEAGGERIGKARERLQALTEGGDITVSRLTVASGLMSDLAGL